MTTSENIRSTLSQLIEPLRDQLDELDKEILQTQVALAELQQVRRDVVGTLSRIDPTFVTAKAEKKQPRSGTKIGPPAIKKVRSWISVNREMLDDEAFSSASLRRMDGFPHMSQGTATKVLHELHAQGLLRLDHTGVGASRYYKVVG